jgi:hypothetical protein
MEAFQDQLNAVIEGISGSIECVRGVLKTFSSGFLSELEGFQKTVEKVLLAPFGALRKTFSPISKVVNALGFPETIKKVTRSSIRARELRLMFLNL